MKKLFVLTPFLLSLSACNTAPMMNRPVAPQQAFATRPMMRAANTGGEMVKIVDRNTTVLNKAKVIETLMNSELSIRKADIYDKAHVFRIEFYKNGQRDWNHGYLMMYVTPTGATRVQLTHNYYNNQPLMLSAQESARILQSASNYQAGSELDQIFNGGR